MASSSPPPLPLELWGCIESYTSNADKKSLRLACRQFNNMVSLRLNRVFLSANPLEIKLLRNIASQDKFRHQVTEIIWDETLLYGVQPQTAGTYPEKDEFLSDKESGVPEWFRSVSERIIRRFKSWKCIDASQAANIKRVAQRFVQLSLGERWQLYLRLFRQQEDVLDDQSDLEAFTFAVKQFTALKRVTITPARHGHLIIPIYPTSLTHAFPKGFHFEERLHPEDVPVTACDQYPGLIDRNRWFRTAIRVLANEPNSVSELVMTSEASVYNFTYQGIHCAIFDEDSDEYNDFVTMLKKPGFRRLDLTLHIGGEDEKDFKASYRSLLNGRLRQVLGEAKNIEEFTLNTAYSRRLKLYGLELPPIPLPSIVPLERWPKLRHFGLSGYRLPQEDCVSFLQTIPKSVRSIELAMPHFTCEDGCWTSLLDVFKDMISRGELWGDRDRRSKPKITIGQAVCRGIGASSETVWFEKEVEDHIYGEKEFPLWDIPPHPKTWMKLEC
ncbi:hypothetical protein N7535_000736 [Penicillium sp. DV-2018c]|nr:hypothetical protein N7535_000736 [Penicillium sp. DV-2018c]